MLEEMGEQYIPDNTASSKKRGAGHGSSSDHLNKKSAWIRGERITTVQTSRGSHNVQIIGSNNIVKPSFYFPLEKLNAYAETEHYKPLAQLGEHIEALKIAYLKTLEEVDSVKDALDLYVGPQGQESVHAREAFPLIDKVHGFLSSEKKVLLLLGEAGSGKTIFNRHLTLMLWAEYKRSPDTPIPLFIALAEHTPSCQDLIRSYLLEQGFSAEAIEELKTERLVFILDGFDEIRDRIQAFYTQNKLDQWANAKVIISSRPEYLGPAYQSQFQKRGQTRALQEYWLSPISDDWMNVYIEKYIQHTQTRWDLEQYQSALNRLPTLKEAIRRPFLLRMALDLLPDLTESKAQLITRIVLYDEFISRWWNRSEERLLHIQLTKQEKKAKTKLGQHLAEKGLRASGEMAVALTRKGVIQAFYDPERNEVEPEAWRAYFKKDAEKRLLLFNAPLIHQGQHYRFIHKSIQDYLVARVICGPRFSSAAPNADAVLNQYLLVDEPLILDFLVERVKQHSSFKAHLYAWIEASKEPDAPVEIGAANAITILVRAEVQFNGADLKGIRIPGADLSYGLFDYTEFQGADLSKVNGYGAWLRGVNLDGAYLKGLELGEKPTLEMQGSVLACCYSPDGRWFAVAESNCIQLYETENLQKVHTYAEHRNRVSSVAFSGDSNWLVSGSWDNTVRLWSVSDNNRSLVHTYSEHKDWVISVAFSEDSKWLASGSYDKTVKLWNVFNDRSLVHTYVGHEGEVNSVAFSKDSQWLASGSNDKTVRLWNVFNNRSLVHTYVGHEGGVNSVAFSKDSQWLASGSNDKTVKLWNVIFDNRSFAHTYAGHRGEVNSVAFSSDGRWLASGSNDKTAKLWDISNARSLMHTYATYEDWVTSITFSVDSQWLASGSNDGTVKLSSILGIQSPIHTYAEHGNWATSLAFSGDGQWLASGSWDKTVKLWNISGEQFLVHTYIGHENGVESVVFSADGRWLASGSKDKLVKLWSISDDPSLVHTYIGHKKEVTSVAFSVDGQWLASGSWDKTVRLWFTSDDRSLAYIYVGHKGEVSSVAFSKDSQWLASGSIDKTVKLWHVLDDRSLAYTYVGHKGEVTSVAFSSDGRWLASGSSDKVVKLWSLRSRSLERTYIGHKGGVNSVAFSSDSQWLLSGGNDNTVIIWFVYPNDQLAIAARLQGSSGPVYSIVWQSMQDGKAALLSTAGADKAIRLWRVPYDSLQIGAIRLNWTSRQDTLIAADARIKNAYNLSPQNAALLRQRGANEDTDEYNINQPSEFESDDESIINENSSFESEESSEEE
ncbi:NACHT domain-containing protein [Mycoavidus sp. SF9855]|uniref:NACHT domain-containing protein n=1 Tax=Mycoavidus sp. SF9855 TaxID=2968475 RepID=UPI00211D0136|nr:NACHT domain-containing protein [Mycoavidus sp. SF9855]UUM20726.1 NACHT domain-containing protein [Mycoavidus sp. SF9855]